MESEFEVIEKIRRRALKASKNIGIGDDCAVIPKDAKTDLVMTTDLLVEDIDFRLEWTSPELLGHKALAVSLSDVAAMGAKPVWAMLSIGLPEKIWKTDFVEKFYDGWFKLAKKFGVELVGGDISKTPDKIVIDSIAAGEAKKGKAILRSGAKPNDLIFVTGSLGGAAAGLRLLKEGIRYDSAEIWQKNLLSRQLAPIPQVYAGEIIGRQNLATSMIDLSDGLSSDLTHLCRAGKVGARVFAEKIPFHKKLGLMTKSFEEQFDFAANGGEDFELLLTVNPKKILRLEKTLQSLTLCHIGEVTANTGIIELITGKRKAVLTPGGFRHF